MNRLFKLTKTLSENRDLALKVKKVQNLKIEGSVVDCVNDLNFDLSTHLFIMANYTDLMNIKIR